MKTLIPLSQFVEDIKNYVHESRSNERALELIFNYTEFLKKPLTLSMFVPCGERYQNILKESNRFNFEHERDYKVYINTYKDAKDKHLISKQQLELFEIETDCFCKVS